MSPGAAPLLRQAVAAAVRTGAGHVTLQIVKDRKTRLGAAVSVLSHIRSGGRRACVAESVNATVTSALCAAVLTMGGRCRSITLTTIKTTCETIISSHYA